MTPLNNPQPANSKAGQAKRERASVLEKDSGARADSASGPAVVRAERKLKRQRLLGSNRCVHRAGSSRWAGIGSLQLGYLVGKFVEVRPEGFPRGLEDDLPTGNSDFISGLFS